MLKQTKTAGTNQCDSRSCFVSSLCFVSIKFQFFLLFILTREISSLITNEKKVHRNQQTNGSEIS